MASLSPDQKPPKPSILVLTSAEYGVNYSKISGEDQVKLCTPSPETARSFLSSHQVYSGPEAQPGPWRWCGEHIAPGCWALPSSLSRAGSCCSPVDTSSSGRNAGPEPMDLTSCPKHSLVEGGGAWGSSKEKALCRPLPLPHVLWEAATP